MDHRFIRSDNDWYPPWVLRAAEGYGRLVSAQNAYRMEAAEEGPVAEWLSPAEHDAWHLMTSVYGRVISRLDADLQEAHEISLRDYQVLVQLSEADGAALRMAELADRLSVSPSGLTRRLDGLVREGLVKRKACQSDRRGTWAVLSSAGWATLEEAAPTHVAGVRRYVFSALRGKRLRDLASGLRAIEAALDDAEIEDGR